MALGGARRRPAARPACGSASRYLDRLFERLEAMLCALPRRGRSAPPGRWEALFPNLAAIRTFGSQLDADPFPYATAWWKRPQPSRLRGRRAQDCGLPQGGTPPIPRALPAVLERRSHGMADLAGFHCWLAAEIEAGRTACVPGSMLGVYNIRVKQGHLCLIRSPRRRARPASRADRIPVLWLSSG